MGCQGDNSHEMSIHTIWKNTPAPKKYTHITNSQSYWDLIQLVEFPTSFQGKQLISLPDLSVKANNLLSMGSTLGMGSTLFSLKIDRFQKCLISLCKIIRTRLSSAKKLAWHFKG